MLTVFWVGVAALGATVTFSSLREAKDKKPRKSARMSEGEKRLYGQAAYAQFYRDQYEREARENIARSRETRRLVA